MSDAERLLTELRLRAGGRTRVPIDAVWEAFWTSVRGYTGSSEARAHLAGLLDALRVAETLSVPKGRRRWDTSAHPALPAWIRLAAPPRASADKTDHRSIAWPPELAFVAELPRTPLLPELLAVRRFLADGGRERILVPTAERSLEMFGDEKRLASLRKTSLFGPGRLSLALLRCYDVAPPLVWERGPAGRVGRPAIVLENLDTYDSFCRWNAGTGAYSAVAYGHGNEFFATVRDLPRVCALIGTNVVEYFGDLDSNGLAIPYGARLVLLDEAPEIELRPADRWYAALLANADVAGPAGDRLAPDAPVLSWLPVALVSRAREILCFGRRLPQEHVGLEQLYAVHRGVPSA